MLSWLLSWAFGWVLGLGVPILITIGAGYLAYKTTGTIRRLAIDALIVAGCWAGMTLVTQSVVSEVIQHERAAVQAAVAAEQARQQAIFADQLARLNEQLIAEQQAADEAERQADDLAAWILANPIAGRGATQRDLDALK